MKEPKPQNVLLIGIHKLNDPYLSSFIDKKQNKIIKRISKKKRKILKSARAIKIKQKKAFFN